MKTVLLALGLFCASLGFTYGQNHDFQVLIGLNMNDCINCFNNGLNKVDKKTNSVNVILVMSELYESDSTQIINKYNLRGITKNIVWSDSMLNWLTGGGRSVIAFTSKYHNLVFRYDLEGLPDDMFDYLHRAGKAIDTLFAAYPKVALGANILNPFFRHDNKIYFIDKVLNEVKGYDLFLGMRILDFAIPDSIIKSTFAYSGIPSAQMEQQHQLLQRAHMASWELNTIFFNKDTIGIIFTNFYFTVEEDSALNRDNVNIIKILNGKVVGTYPFPISFKNDLDKGKEYWVSTHQVYQANGYLHTLIYSNPKKGQQRYDYHVLGGFKPDKSGTYVLGKLNPKKNSLLFSQSLACIFPTFNQGYFAFPLIDTLYSVSGDQPAIPLNIIPENYQFSSPKERCFDGIFIDGFYITDDYVWVSYSDHTKYYETVVRHNRHTGENEYAKNAIKFNKRIFTRFDPIDPDYLLFTLPNKNSLLHRAKMF